MANGNHREISVIMCAYTQERWLDLQQAIESINDQTIQPNEVILVIDHNPELLKAAQATFRGVNVIENSGVKGLSAARNSGLARSTGEIVAFIDEDAIADANWLETLLHSYDDPGVMGVGGEVRPMWGATPPAWFPEEYNWVVGCSYKGLPTTTSPVRNPIGCNMSFRRNAIDCAGGFRIGIGRIGKIPLGCEETELAIRIRQLAPDSIYLFNPKAAVYHKVPQWRTRWTYFVSRCYAEGRSKALVTLFVGANDGLSSERRYVVHTLSQAVIDDLKRPGLREKAVGVTRAFAILTGLFLTTLGYVVGVLSNRKIEKTQGLDSLSASLGHDCGSSPTMIGR